MRNSLRCVLPVLLTIILGACSRTPGTQESPESRAPAIAAFKFAAVTGARITAADKEPHNWLSHGRSYSEQRFSPLTSINDKTVAELGLAWTYPLGIYRGIEATPLVIDGVMYTTGAWSIVFALNAKTGDLLWKYDPKVDKAKSQHACCDAVNRGLAAWGNNVYLGTLDGRLVALNAQSGGVVWSVQTVDKTKAYTITGAPRVIKGKVLIGNSGAEFDVRGYVSAYDARTGKQVWRFYTIPGDPSKPFENNILKMAAKTWTGEWWKYGGGGTVWDAMVYDETLDLVYIGVGNGAPWNQRIRSPQGGDNLFLSSIVALRPDTGEYVWHYQTTPGETWDYTATQPIILADLLIEGTTRKVLMQAPKNGFFYVIDRVTGQFISAEKFVPINWASHVDPVSGRPVELENARYANGPTEIRPSPFGAHNWHPMSFSPDTGLVYFSAQELAHVYGDEPEGFRYRENSSNLGVDFSFDDLPNDKAVVDYVKSTVRGHLVAWNPVAQKEAWRVQYTLPWNGGTLATAGNLVFQGTTDRRFVAYSADKGELLWAHQVNSGVVAGPVSYAIDGEQYIAVMSGWGTLMPLATGLFVKPEVAPIEGVVLVYKLGGKAVLAPRKTLQRTVPKPPPLAASTDTLIRGKRLYYANCMGCHGLNVVSGGVTPDLRYSQALHNESWFTIVIDGVLASNGMMAFSHLLERSEAADIRQFVIERANWLWSSHAKESGSAQ